MEVREIPLQEILHKKPQNKVRAQSTNGMETGSSKPNEFTQKNVLRLATLG